MKPELSPIEGQFAFEVLNVDPSGVLDDSTIRELDDHWGMRGVLIFRRQALSEAELVDFSARFGTPDVIVRTDWASRQHPEITRITNLRDAAGAPLGGLGSGELDWHADQSYMPTPATGAILYGVEVPENGPNTYWANLQIAYDALPDATKNLIDDKQGIFSYAKRVATYDQESTPEEVKSKTPDVLHPLVHRHPVSGKKALYLDPATMSGIDGMSETEGNALLDELNAHATRPEFVYRHDWQIGDLIMWDNGFLLHRRDAFPRSQNRLLKRTTIRLPASRHIIPN